LKTQPISEKARNILLTLYIHKSKSFNELRNPPHKFNPKTLSKQLHRLEKTKLIKKNLKKVRGGTQHRYQLTKTGHQWLQQPINITQQTYQTILTMIIQQMQLHSDLEPKIFANDLIENRKTPHTLNLQTELTIQSHKIQTNTSWEMNKRGNLKISEIETSKMLSVQEHQQGI
jgi:DNA-binding HxlR family transcriptional regulator